MKSDNVVQLPSPEAQTSRSVLDEIIRAGAREMLQAALEAEVAGYVEQFANVVGTDGHRVVVRRYSNHAIETAVTLGMVLHLASRQTEGFLRSLFALVNLDNDVPDHTTISRRKAKLGKVPLDARQNRKPVHLLIDSSGLKIHVGKLRKPPANRDWRKLHLGVDEGTGDIVACDLTSKSARDPCRVPSLLRKIDRPILSFRADAAYDEASVYEAVERRKGDRSPRFLIPPRKRAPRRASVNVDRGAFENGD